MPAFAQLQHLPSQEPSSSTMKSDPYNVCLRFEWDRVKAASNAKKQKVTFEVAKTVSYDDFAMQFFDEEHSGAEDRFFLLGMSSDARLLLV